MRQLVVSALARRGAASLTLRSSSGSGGSGSVGISSPRAALVAASPRPRAIAAAVVGAAAAHRRRAPLTPPPPPRASPSSAAPAAVGALDGPVPWPGAPAGDLDARPPLSILRYPDPRLRAPNPELGPAAFLPGPNARRLADLACAMAELMYDDDGVGLAAPQVGCNCRLMVFNETGVRGDPAETVLVNPRIISRSAARETDDEGCLSFPGLATERGVERPASVRVAAQGLDGSALAEFVLTGWPARVFQHEYDHLEGTLLADRLAPGDLEAWRPTLVAWEEEFLAAAPPGEAARVRRLAPPAPPKPAKAAGFGGGGGGAGGGSKKRR